MKKSDGGTGRDANNGRGGPGGSSAGSAANGTSQPAIWSTIIASAAPTDGGIGGNGGNIGVNGVTGTTPGGGGGGSGDINGGANRSGGDGAPGRVIITLPAT